MSTRPGQYEHFVEFLAVMYPKAARLHRMIERAATCYKAAMEYIEEEDILYFVRLSRSNTAFNGNKIQLIKTIRQHTGLDLKDSVNVTNNLLAGQAQVLSTHNKAKSEAEAFVHDINSNFSSCITATLC